MGAHPFLELLKSVHENYNPRHLDLAPPVLHIGLLASMTRSSATAQKQRVSCPHEGGLSPPVHSPSILSRYTYAYGRIRNPQQTYVKRDDDDDDDDEQMYFNVA